MAEPALVVGIPLEPGGAASDGAGSSHSTLRSHIVFDSSQSSGVSRSSNQSLDEDAKAAAAAEAEARAFPPQTLELHNAQECTPCYYMALRKCRKGDTCKFCHFPHEKKAKARPRKAKREFFKKEINDLDVGCVESPEAFLENIRRIIQSSVRGDFSILVLKSKLRSMAESENADIARLANTALDTVIAEAERRDEPPTAEQASVEDASARSSMHMQREPARALARGQLSL
eukprot:TRINITY_DN56882_c0_g1_i1.p1 TRINITY_DN56882_c0_g1~~TRINITY_DN56882_c0_g1_i1.p1  ORF type:complete len:239 (-),score=49.45 TRINITY_DN56882_c0_g1_i1:278-970(-)